MNSKNNFLVQLLDFTRELFEHMSPSLFALLSTIIPYLSPLPIAFFTASNATRYLGFTPTISGIFVFVLESLGLWVTSVLVDSVLEFIRSRNSKTGIMILIFGAVTGVYIAILISLNVSLESADPTKVMSPAYTKVITLISFIPLLTGFMNGWHKAKLDNDKRMELSKIESRLQNESQSEKEHARKMEMERLKSEERIRKAELRGQRSSGKPLQELNRSFNFEVSASKNSSESLQSSLGKDKKVKFVEATANFIEAFLKQNSRMPKLTDITENLGGSESNAYYAVVEYIVRNGEGLVSSGIVSQEKLDKAIVAWDKKNKNKKHVSEE